MSNIIYKYNHGERVELQWYDKFAEGIIVETWRKRFDEDYISYFTTSNASTKMAMYSILIIRIGGIDVDGMCANVDWILERDIVGLICSNIQKNKKLAEEKYDWKICLS